MRHSKTLWLAAMAMACAGNKPAEAPEVSPEQAPPVWVDAPTFEVPDFSEQLLAAMQPDTPACDDFYEHACGGWFEATELPSDRPMFTRSFSVIGDRNRTLLRGLLESEAAAPAPSQLGAFYKACMDMPARDAAGTKPVQAHLTKVSAVTDAESLMRTIGELQRDGIDVLFSTFVSADAKNPDRNVLTVVQGGLGLPDRSHYLSEDSANTRNAYVAHVARMFELSGAPPSLALTRAQQVMAFESRLAKVSWERAALRDSDAVYNKLDRDGWQALQPNVPLEPFFEALWPTPLSEVVVMTPSFFEGLHGVLGDTEPELWRSYLAWQVIHEAARSLGSAARTAHFEFYGRTLYGQQTERELWKDCVDSANSLVGDLVAEAFIERAFTGESKPVAEDMIKRIEVAFEEGLPELTWMDDATRDSAVHKARKITNKIGYPDTWKAYDFETDPGDHAGNVRRGTRHVATYWLDKAEKPVDPDEWFMPAPTVNAYYNPSENEIVFPAGILQPPFFHVDWPKAANFGAMGMVMGHEITHGFDDEGRKYTGDGALQDWWEPAVVDAFEERADCVVDQYSGFTVADDAAVNGELTLGENIADIGGTRVALRAYRSWRDEHGDEAEVGGLTSDQQFFVSMAQAWCTVASDEALELQVTTDPHAPARFRVNGTLQNLPDFAEAFGCEAGDPMAPVDACEVW